MSIVVRQMQPSDSVAALAIACPHSVGLTPALLLHQLAALKNWPETLALVAEEAGAVIGLCQAKGVRLIASDGYVEILTLGVSSDKSDAGVAASLLDAIAIWAIDLGYRRVRVRSSEGMTGVPSVRLPANFMQAKAGYIFSYDLRGGNFPDPGPTQKSVDCRIRVGTSTDVQAISEILPSLGYSAAPEVIGKRITRLLYPDNQILLAERQGGIVGLCQVEGTNALIAGKFAEIHALAVASGQQRKGTGAALLWHALGWAYRHGFANVRLGSGVHRESAHAFYRSQGFAQAEVS